MDLISRTDRACFLYLNISQKWQKLRSKGLVQNSPEDRPYITSDLTIFVRDSFNENENMEESELFLSSSNEVLNLGKFFCQFFT